MEFSLNFEEPTQPAYSASTRMTPIQGATYQPRIPMPSRITGPRFPSPSHVPLMALGGSGVAAMNRALSQGGVHGNRVAALSPLGGPSNRDPLNPIGYERQRSRKLFSPSAARYSGSEDPETEDIGSQPPPPGASSFKRERTPLSPTPSNEQLPVWTHQFRSDVENAQPAMRRQPASSAAVGFRPMQPTVRGTRVNTPPRHSLGNVRLQQSPLAKVQKREAFWSGSNNTVKPVCNANFNKNVSPISMNVGSRPATPKPVQPSGTEMKNETLRVLTAPIELLRHWSMILQGYQVMYEVYGYFYPIMSGDGPKEFLLKAASGATVKVFFMEIDRCLPYIARGTYARCMVLARNERHDVFQCVSVRQINPRENLDQARAEAESLEVVQRLTYQ